LLLENALSDTVEFPLSWFGSGQKAYQEQLGDVVSRPTCASIALSIGGVLQDAVKKDCHQSAPIQLIEDKASGAADRGSFGCPALILGRSGKAIAQRPCTVSLPMSQSMYWVDLVTTDCDYSVRGLTKV